MLLTISSQLLSAFQISIFAGWKLSKMSANSLGILAMIYATGELQNPLHRKTINNPAGRSDAFLHS